MRASWTSSRALAAVWSWAVASGTGVSVTEGVKAASSADGRSPFGSPSCASPSSSLSAGSKAADCSTSPSRDGLLATSCELRAEAALEAGCFGLSAPSVDARAGRSELCRGLPAADVPIGDDSGFGLPAALLAATALASLSWSLSLGLFVEADLEGPGESGVSEEGRAGHRRAGLPGLSLGDAAGVGTVGGGFGCFPASESSARMLSSRASMPATACVRKDPHLDEPFPGAAMTTEWPDRA